MELCPKCGSVLRIGNTSYSFENDDTAEKETKAFYNMQMLCVNSKAQVDTSGTKVPCVFYAGENTAEPKYIVATVKNPVN